MTGSPIEAGVLGVTGLARMVDEEPIDVPQALSWLNARIGQPIVPSLSSGPERRGNLRDRGHAAGRLPGGFQLVDHRGGIVRDDMVGDCSIQLCEDDLRQGWIEDDEHAHWLHLDLGDAQVNFSDRRTSSP